MLCDLRDEVPDLVVCLVVVTIRLLAVTNTLSHLPFWAAPFRDKVAPSFTRVDLRPLTYEFYQGALSARGMADQHEHLRF